MFLWESRLIEDPRNPKLGALNEEIILKIGTLKEDI
jgi:hypothetical protein